MHLYPNLLHPPSLPAHLEKIHQVLWKTDLKQNSHAIYQVLRYDYGLNFGHEHFFNHLKKKKGSEMKTGKKKVTYKKLSGPIIPKRW